MNQVFARLKRLQVSPFRKVVSGNRLFEYPLPTAGSCIEYDPQVLLHEDEWFKVSQFSTRDFFPKFIRDEDLTNSVDIKELAKHEFEKISFLVALQDGRYYFQRVRPSSILRKKFVRFGDVAVIEDIERRIVINSYPDAVYIPDTDRLIFREFPAATLLFQGMDKLYRQATEGEVKNFLRIKFVSVQDFDSSQVSKPNRKRIALALEVLESMTDTEFDSILDYLRSYCGDTLVFDDENENVVIKNDIDIKNVIFGIQQRFYTTELSGDRRLANGVIELP